MGKKQLRLKVVYDCESSISSYFYPPLVHLLGTGRD